MNKRGSLLLALATTLVVGCNGEGDTPQVSPVATAGTVGSVSPSSTPIPVATAEPSLEPTAAQAAAIEEAQGLYLLDAVSGSATKISDARAYELAWTPDGAKLWYSTVFYPAPSLTTRDEPAEVRAVDVSSGADALVWALGRGGFASLAPAAGRVAFVRHVGGVEDPTSVQGGRVEYTVHVLDPERGELDFGSGLNAQLRQDGTRLLYGTPSCADIGVIRSVDLQSGSSSTLAENAFAAQPRWLADGRVLFQRYERPGFPVPNVWYPETGAVERLAVEGIAADGLASLSPDGTVALIHYLGRTFLREMAAGTQKDLGEGYSRDAEWTADSRALAYMVNDDGRLRVRIVSRDGTVRTTFHPSQDPRVFAQPSSIEWSPSGDRLAVAVALLLGHGVCT